MSTKYRHPGEFIDYIPAAAVLSSAVVVVNPGPAGLIGVAEADIAASGTGAVRVEGVHELTALSTDTGSVGDEFYWDAANSRLTSTKTGNTKAGFLTVAKTNGQTTAFVKLAGISTGGGLVGSLTAAGTALSNSTTETALGTVTIPANTLKAGDVVRIRYQAIATATNSTDTLAVSLKIGGVSGTALIAHAATDVADNNVVSGEFELTIRTTGASGTCVGVGTYKSVPAAEGTMTVKDDILASTTIDTTAAQAVVVTGTWSVASASNSCRLDVLNVSIVR